MSKYIYYTRDELTLERIVRFEEDGLGPLTMRVIDAEGGAPE